MRNVRHAAFLAALTCPAYAAVAQQLAFPEAEGFGRFATGARTDLAAASVYRVTNLNDAGAGSFRDAVSRPNRFVVFDVGGVVNLASAVSVQENVTIAGQTAPGGVTLYGAKVSFTGADNAVARHLRVRKGTTTGRDDAVSLASGRNMMFDHLSVTWGNDETFSMNPSSGATIDRITVQNSIVGQGLDNVNHSAGGLMTPNGSFSVLRSLFTGNETRNPKVKGTNQFVNNVVYNWTTAGYILGGDSEGDSYANVVGNYFISGPADTSPGAPFSGGNANFRLFAENNKYDASEDGVLNGSVLSQSAYGPVAWQPTPFDHPSVLIDSPEAAYQRVVDFVGPSLSRDVVDQRMIQELTSLGTQGQIVVREGDLFPGYAATRQRSGGRRTDTDADGIPDNWEIARGSSPTNAADWKTVAPSGYTRLEEYLNELGGAQVDTTWAAAAGAWPTGPAWTGGTPTLASQAFVRGTGPGTSGQVTVNQVGAFARRLFIGGNGAAAGERVTVDPGGTLDVFDTLHVGFQNNATLAVNGGTVSAGVVLLGGAGATAYTGTLALNGGTLETGFIRSPAGTAAVDWNGGTIRAIADPDMTVPATLGPAGGTFDTNGYSGTFAGVLSGPGALAKTGAGTLLLTGDNAYAGGTTIGGGGALKVGHNRGAGAGPIAIASSGGAVHLANGVTLANDVRTSYLFEVLDVPDDAASATYAGVLTQTGTTPIRVQASGAGATLTVTGSINAAGRNFILKTGNVVVAGSGSVAGVGGAVGRATGATTLTLRDNAAFNIGGFSMGGGQPLTSGTITVQGAATLSTGAAALDLLNTTTGAATSTLNLDGGTTTVGSLAKTSTGAAQTSAVHFNGGTLRYGGAPGGPTFLPALPGLTAAVRAGGARIDDAGQAITIAQPLVHDAAMGAARDGGLEKLGAGTLTLAAANTYTGQTTVTAGTLRVGAADAVPHGAGKGNVSIAAAGTFDLNGWDVAVNGLPAAADAVVDNTAAAAVTLTVGDADTSTTGTPSFNGTIRNTGGPVALTKVGTGSFRMQTNPSTYSGDTTVVAGTLDLNGANLLPFGPGRGDVRVNAGATLGLRFGQLVNALADGPAGGGSVQALSSGTKTLTLGSGDRDGAFSGSIVNGAGAIALAKAGPGTQTLTGDSSYTGATTVSGGTLLVNGTHSGGGYSVGANGTLGGTGSIAGTLTVAAGGRVAPGASPGVLSVTGSVTLAAGADLVVELNGPAPGGSATSHDQLAVTGTVTLSGTTNGTNGADLVAALGYAPALGDRLFVVRNDGTDPVAGTFQGLPQGGSFDLTSAADGQTYRFTVSYTGDAEANLSAGGNDVLLTSVAVPEPATAGALLTLGATGLLGRRRKAGGRESACKKLSVSP